MVDIISIEHSPAREGGRATFTINEFCGAHRISRSKLYQLWAENAGPRWMCVGNKKLITIEAAADWRHELETVSQQGPA